MSSFVPNTQCVPMIKRSKELQQSLGDTADQIARTAREIAPVLTGRYRDSIEGIDGFERGEVQARIVAKDNKSHWIEFGAKHMPTYATLRRAAELNGFRVRESRG